MIEMRELWRHAVLRALTAALDSTGLAGTIGIESVIGERPPRPELGDIAFPMFPFARTFKKNPAEIARAVVGHLESDARTVSIGNASADGPYVNVRFDIAQTAAAVLLKVGEAGNGYGWNQTLAGQKIMVEFSCPNTNKPLHLGHLRNDAIGESVSEILRACGAEVRKVNLINDRGVHICKSMLAYEKFGDGATPQSVGMKSDHFVGDYYVKYAEWSKTDPSAEEQVRELLVKWESGDPETVALWKTMNGWAIDGIKETYAKTGIEFDQIYSESETYSEGKREILRGLEEGIFYRADDGSIRIDLTAEGLDDKVLLRSDGTSVYITQDIGTAIARHRDWPFDRLIYVVASEQQYHFKVLFNILEKLGFSQAGRLFHLSYGMVNLPEGRMKSREGTVVDADDLLALLARLAEKEIRDKGREGDVSGVEDTAGKIALAAVNYFLLSVAPLKDMIFDPKDSISFTGDTGPYLQYMGARISSMLEKFNAREAEFSDGRLDPAVFAGGDEWELVKLIDGFPETVERAGAELNPSLVAARLYDLAKVFSRYYHDNPVLHNEDHDVVQSRIALSRAVLQVLMNGFAMLGLPFLEKM